MAPRRAVGRGPWLTVLAMRRGPNPCRARSISCREGKSRIGWRSANNPAPPPSRHRGHIHENRLISICSTAQKGVRLVGQTPPPTALLSSAHRYRPDTSLLPLSPSTAAVGRRTHRGQVV